MFKKFHVQLIILVGVVLLLTSCAETNSKPNCNKVGGKGVGCVSMDTAYGMSKQGYFDRNRPDPADDSANSNPNISDPAQSSLFINKADVNWQPMAGQPLRYGETVQVIWIAPYVDSVGDYYYPHQVSTIVKNGYWIGAPQSEINLSGDN